MRPSDENQAGSKRPNLMSSSRRANGEINILAMLDGRSGRPLSRRGRALPAALWYASALLVACALVGTLAWLAHDGAAARYPGAAAAHAGDPQTGGPHAGDPHAAAGATDGAVDARTGRPAAAPATAAAGAPADTSLEASLAAATQALAADAARIDADAGHGNTEDAADDRPAAGHNGPAATAMPSAMHATMAPTALSTVPAAPAPVPGLVPASPPLLQHAGRATVIDLAPPQDRLAATPGLPPVPPVPSGSSVPLQVSAASASDPGRDGFHPPPPGMPGAAGPGALVGGARGAMGRTPATHRPAQPPMARSGVPARPRRPVATANPAPAVDGDVALITAIIQHTNRAGGKDSQEAGGAACAERSCGPRMPDRP